MEACFHHEIKKINKKGNCDFLTHNSDFFSQLQKKVARYNLRIMRKKQNCEISMASSLQTGFHITQIHFDKPNNDFYFRVDRSYFFYSLKIRH